MKFIREWLKRRRETYGIKVFCGCCDRSSRIRLKKGTVLHREKLPCAKCGVSGYLIKSIWQ